MRGLKEETEKCRSRTAISASLRQYAVEKGMESGAGGSSSEQKQKISIGGTRPPIG